MNTIASGQLPISAHLVIPEESGTETCNAMNLQAGSDPETSGPAENLREKAAKTTDEGQDSKEPA